MAPVDTEDGMGLALPDSTLRNRPAKPADTPKHMAPERIERTPAERRHARAAVLWVFAPSFVMLVLAVWALWQATHDAK